MKMSGREKNGITTQHKDAAAAAAFLLHLYNET